MASTNSCRESMKGIGSRECRYTQTNRHLMMSTQVLRECLKVAGGVLQPSAQPGTTLPCMTQFNLIDTLAWFQCNLG